MSDIDLYLLIKRNENIPMGRAADAFSVSTVLSQNWDLIDKANKGSIDAAKELFNKLFPGTKQYSIVTDPTCLCVKFTYWPNGLSGSHGIVSDGWHEDNEGRAWLLAMLKALVTQQTISQFG